MIFLLHGNDSFLKHRRLQELKGQVASEGYDVSDMSVGPECLQTAQGSVFFTSKKAIVVRDAEKDTDTCLQLTKLVDDDLMVIFFCGSKLRKTSKLLKAIPKGNVQSFEKPDKAYKMDDYAQKFVIAEAKRLKTPFEKAAIAQAIVTRCGVDLGTLRWEVYKASILAQSQSRSQITVADIKGTICPIEQIGPYGMLQALESKSIKGFLRAAKRCEQSSGRDPTMGAIALLYPAIIQWLSIYELSQQGGSPSEIAAEMKMNPWLVGKMLKPSQRWGYGSKNLLRILSTAEKSVKNGASYSWGYLVASLTKEISK